MNKITIAGCFTFARPGNDARLTKRGYMLFYDVALGYLDNDSDDLAKLTAKTYRWNLKKFNQFSPGLQCDEVNERIVRKFKAHLLSLNNKPATVMKALSVLRVFVNKMRKDSLISVDPFANVKIGRVYSRRGFLTMPELKKLYVNFLDFRATLTETEQNVMRVFLFSCFTGLRYSDLRTLDSSEIVDWKIRKQMHKTGDAVYIPIPMQARPLLPPNNHEGPVFHVVDNSHFNKTLRSAGKKLGYGKRLHCHLARHTFATTCITLGIPLHATSKLLGHRNLDTTLIYAKYVDTYLDKEMSKFKDFC